MGHPLQNLLPLGVSIALYKKSMTFEYERKYTKMEENKVK
jgi:hypothetical protein